MKVGGRCEGAVKLPGPVALEVNCVDEHKASEVVENAWSDQITYHLICVLSHPAVDLIRTAIGIAPEKN